MSSFLYVILHRPYSLCTTPVFLRHICRMEQFCTYYSLCSPASSIFLMYSHTCIFSAAYIYVGCKNFLHNIFLVSCTHYIIIVFSHLYFCGSTFKYVSCGQFDFAVPAPTPTPAEQPPDDAGVWACVCGCSCGSEWMCVREGVCACVCM